jgi:signal transduction histidine kinase
VRENAQSLLRVIAVRMLTVTLIWLALMIAFVQSEVERNARALRSQSLETTARMLARQIDTGSGDLLFTPPATELPAGYRFAVRDGAGHLIAASDDVAETLALPPLLPSQPSLDPYQATIRQRDARTDTIALPDGRKVLAVEIGLPVADGATATVLVAEDESNATFLLDALVDQFFVRIGWLLIPGVGLLLAVSLLSIRAELRPIEHVAAVAETIGPHGGGVRLPDRFVPREILPLIDTVNRALDRLERTLQAQREFTADAAHELKTPLAVMRAQIDAMRPDADAMALRDDVDRMSRLVTQLLRLAEADQLAVAADAACDLAAIARDVAAALAPLALARGRSLALAGAEAPVWVRGVAAPVAQAVRNLVENAIKHSPPGTIVDIRVTPTGAALVRDRGPGIPEAERAHVFKRFWRKDRNAEDGAGLGLAIAAKIVEAHGGHLSVGDAEDGGAVFAIDLVPIPPPPASDRTGATA